VIYGYDDCKSARTWPYSPFSNDEAPARVTDGNRTSADWQSRELHSMKIFVGQIYIEPEASYPFSHQFQIWFGQELTKRVQASQRFRQTYSDDFDLIFCVSAKTKITEPEIKGPTVFKRDKDVEFTVFLPHDGRERARPSEYRQPLKLLLDSIVTVLQGLGMDASRVMEDSPALIEYVTSNPEMIKRHKPLASSG